MPRVLEHMERLNKLSEGLKSLLRAELQSCSVASKCVCFGNFSRKATDFYITRTLNLNIKQLLPCIVEGQWLLKRRMSTSVAFSSELRAGMPGQLFKVLDFL